MASGIKALRKIQAVIETAKGTPIAATFMWLGELTMKESPTIYRAAEERGEMAQFHRSTKVANLAEMTFDADATFEQILYPLEIGVASATGVVTATTARTWTFTPNMTTPGTFQSLTVEYGDDIQANEVEYVMARSIVISGAMNEPVKVKADLFGRQMTTTAFTPALTAPTVEIAIARKAKLYIDSDATASMGTTECPATLIAWDFNIDTGLTPTYYADGNTYFTSYTEKAKNAELRMTLAYNSTAVTERTRFDGGTIRMARIQITGATAGTTAATKTINLDMTGIYSTWDTLSERDGEDVVQVTLSGQRGANYTKLFEVSVINTSTAL